MKRTHLIWFALLTLCLVIASPAEARRKHRRKRYTGPPPTHPVVLWARTLSESTDKEQRKVAAFKLSQYSQTIHQENVISVIVKCMKDPEVQIKVLCTKAMGKAGNNSKVEWVRKALFEQYQADPVLRNTIVRVFIARRDASPTVQDTFLDAAKKSTDTEELLVLASYFEAFSYGNDKFVDVFADLYKKNEDTKLRRAIVKSLAERAHGQDKVIDILSQCADSKDTPLSLTCLSGLQLQAKKDPRAWAAVEKTVESSDPDVLMATLDVINALPEAANPKISNRLVDIISSMDDPELQEKAVLALGVCGDQNENMVKVLQKELEDKETEESTRIAAALVLGKQASSFPDAPQKLLSECSRNNASPSLRLACQLGQKELDSRKGVNAQTVTAPPPSPSPAPTAAKAPEIRRANSSDDKVVEKTIDKVPSDRPEPEVDVTDALKMP